MPVCRSHRTHSCKGSAVTNDEQIRWFDQLIVAGELDRLGKSFEAGVVVCSSVGEGNERIFGQQRFLVYGRRKGIVAPYDSERREDRRESRAGSDTDT